jgi:hypothetical protein
MLTAALLYIFASSPVGPCNQSTAQKLLDTWVAASDQSRLRLLGVDPGVRLFVSRRFRMRIENSAESKSPSRVMYTVVQNNTTVGLFGLDEANGSCAAASFGHARLASAISRTGVLQRPGEDEPELLLDPAVNRYSIVSKTMTKTNLDLIPEASAVRSP